MKHIPGYLMPGHKKGTEAIGIVKTSKVPFRKIRDDEKSRKKLKHMKFPKGQQKDDKKPRGKPNKVQRGGIDKKKYTNNQKGQQGNKKKNDPLKTFQYKKKS